MDTDGNASVRGAERPGSGGGLDFLQRYRMMRFRRCAMANAEASPRAAWRQVALAQARENTKRDEVSL